MSLTDKQTIFIDEYLKCWNATKAARRAKYKGNDHTLASVGRENLSKPMISAAIETRLTESAMSADEALMRLGQMARGDLGDFADVNFREDLKDHPLSHLIKKLTVITSQTGDKVQHKLQLELYDAQKAVVDILKEHGRFNNDAGSSEDKPLVVKVVKGVSMDDL